jgi:hypothetical protein
MPSLANDDYRLIGAIQGSRAETWYRQLLHAQQPRRADGRYHLSCDCPSWTANQSGARTCKHTTITSQILDGNALAGAASIAGDALTIRTVIAMQPLLQGIHGEWRVTECHAPIKGASYRFSLLDVTLPHIEQERTSGIAGAFVALAERANPTVQDISAAVAAWAGWAVAAEVARLSGFGQVIVDPEICTVNAPRFGRISR